MRPNSYPAPAPAAKPPAAPRRQGIERRDVQIGVKLTRTEAEAIKRNAAEAGMSVADYIASRCCA